MVGLQSLDLPIGVRIPVSQPKSMDEWHETEVRVRYAETDQMGIAHHANYLIWFESARSDFCRARGFSYKDMEEKDNALLVVAESYCRYKSPAFYDDLLKVRARVGEIRSRSLRFIYEIYRSADETLIAEGETLHLVTDENKKVRILPEIYREKLLGDPIPEVNAFPANQAPH
jgi:acyl-CoA thioester hydrolase